MTRPTSKPRRKVLAEGWAWRIERIGGPDYWMFTASEAVTEVFALRGRETVRAQLIEVPERKKRGAP